MKKLICITLSICLLISFSAVAFAVEPTTFTGEGFYVKSNGGLTISMKTDSGDAKEKMVELVADSKVFVPLYEDSIKMDVTLEDAAAGNYLVILTSKTDEGMPTESNEIYYIDQTTSNEGTVSFTVYPKDVDLGSTNHLDMKMYITSSAEGFEMKTAELGYADGTFNIQEYVLGDVNGDGDIMVDDAVLVLNNVAGNLTFSVSEKGAADVTHDGVIMVDDAVKILNKIAGNIDVLE